MSLSVEQLMVNVTWGQRLKDAAIWLSGSGEGTVSTKTRRWENVWSVEEYQEVSMSRTG